MRLLSRIVLGPVEPFLPRALFLFSPVLVTAQRYRPLHLHPILLRWLVGN
jgi:hypothetical protein